MTGYELFHFLEDIDINGAPHVHIENCSAPVVLSNDITGRYEHVTSVSVVDHYGQTLVVLHADADEAAVS